MHALAYSIPQTYSTNHRYVGPKICKQCFWLLCHYMTRNFYIHSWEISLLRDNDCEFVVGFGGVFKSLGGGWGVDFSLYPYLLHFLQNIENYLFIRIVFLGFAKTVGLVPVRLGSNLSAGFLYFTILYTGHTVRWSKSLSVLGAISLLASSTLPSYILVILSGDIRVCQC